MANIDAVPAPALSARTSPRTGARGFAVGAAGERGRAHIVRLVMCAYALLIVEGAIRKWLLPHYSYLLFFVRDPFIFASYAIAIVHGYWPRRQTLLSVGIGLGALALVLVALQVGGSTAGIQDKQVLLAAYGWRNYFLYIPLPFIVAETFSADDLRRLMRLTMILAIPIAVLVAIQFYSPLNAPINVGLAADIAEQFHGLGLTGSRTRPMGTFSSDIGQKEFTVSCLAILMALWIVPASRRQIARWLLLLATGAALTCLALSGSRGAMLQSAIVLIAAVGSALLLRGGVLKARAALIPATIGVAAVILYPIVFAEGYGAFVERWSAAAATEQTQFQWGLLGRALLNFTNFVDLMANAPLVGYGLGLAGNASITLGIVVKGFTGWAESDWARHIVDLGPVFGVVFIAYRIALTAWLGSVVLRASARAPGPLPIMLFSFVALDLLAGQVTGQGSVNGYVWLFTGLCLAACREAPVGAPGPRPGAGAQPRFANLLR